MANEILDDAWEKHLLSARQQMGGSVPHIPDAWGSRVQGLGQLSGGDVPKGETDGNGPLGWFKDSADAGFAGYFGGQARAAAEFMPFGNEQLNAFADYMDEIVKANSPKEELKGLDYVMSAAGNAVGSGGAGLAELGLLTGLGSLAGLGGAAAGAVGVASKLPAIGRVVGLAQKMWQSPFGKYLVANVASSPLEAVAEAGNLITQMREEGYTDEEIREAALRSAGYNTAWLTVANMLEAGALGKITGALGEKAAAEGAKAIAQRGLLSAGSSAVSEGGEEYVQSLIGDYSKQGNVDGLDYDAAWEAAKMGATGGAVLGGLGGGLGAYLNSRVQPTSEVQEEQQVQEQPTSQVQEQVHDLSNAQGADYEAMLDSSKPQEQIEQEEFDRIMREQYGIGQAKTVYPQYGRVEAKDRGLRISPKTNQYARDVEAKKQRQQISSVTHDADNLLLQAALEAPMMAKPQRGLAVIGNAEVGQVNAQQDFADAPTTEGKYLRNYEQELVDKYVGNPKLFEHDYFSAMNAVKYAFMKGEIDQQSAEVLTANLQGMYEKTRQAIRNNGIIRQNGVPHARPIKDVLSGVRQSRKAGKGKQDVKLTNRFESGTKPTVQAPYYVQNAVRDIQDAKKAKAEAERKAKAFDELKAQVTEYVGETYADNRAEGIDAELQAAKEGRKELFAGLVKELKEGMGHGVTRQYVDKETGEVADVSDLKGKEETKNNSASYNREWYSNNAPWYQNWYKANGRKPTNAELYEIAENIYLGNDEYGSNLIPFDGSKEADEALAQNQANVEYYDNLIKIYEGLKVDAENTAQIAPAAPQQAQKQEGEEVVAEQVEQPVNEEQQTLAHFERTEDGKHKVWVRQNDGSMGDPVVFDTWKEAVEFAHEQNLPLLSAKNKKATTEGGQNLSKEGNYIAKNSKDVFDVLTPHIGEEIVNKQTNQVATFGRTGIDKLTSKKAYSKSNQNGFDNRMHFSAAANIIKLFENATLADTHRDNAVPVGQHTNILNMKVFESPFVLDGEKATAKITVKESVQHGNKIYSIELLEIKKDPVAYNETADNERQTISPSESFGSSNIPQDAEEVKKQDVKHTKTKIEDFGEKLGGARKDEFNINSFATITEKPKKEKSSKQNKEEADWRKPFEVVKDEDGWGIKYTAPQGRMGDYRYTNLTHELFDSQEKAEFKLKATVFEVNYGIGYDYDQNRNAQYYVFKRVGKNKQFKMSDYFDSKEEALKYVAKNIDAILNQKTSFGEGDLISPLIKHWKDARKGNVKDRLKGKNATKEMFVDDFGFRTVQFGNWNNQEERQEVMNAAYEALHDLADVLGVPSKIISLNGELSLAFGARGRGLSGAKAHYEPEYMVINLTKMKGAGSLAHEWLHALDHYLTIKGGIVSNERNADGSLKEQLEKKINNWHQFASDRSSFAAWTIKRADINDSLKEKFSELMESLYYKKVMVSGDIEDAQNWVAKATSYLDRELTKLREYIAKERQWGKRKTPASKAQLEKFDKLALEFVDNENQLEWNAEKQRWSTPALETMGDLVKEITGRGFSKDDDRVNTLISLKRRVETRQRILNEALNGVEKEQHVPTQYSKNNTTIDSGRTTDYWTKPTEMLARAFSAMIEDSLKAKGSTSDFLSYGSDNRLLFFGKPFPEGEERKLFNKNIRSFLDEVVKEVEANKKKTGEIKFSVHAALNNPAGSQQNALRSIEEILEEVEDALADKAKSVDKVGDDVVVTMNNGKRFVLKIEDEIIVSDEVSRRANKDHGFSEDADGIIEGYWEQVDRNDVDGVLAISRQSDKGVAYHEVMHMAMDLALNDKERAALIKAARKEAEAKGKLIDEVIADKYAEWVQARKNGKGTAFGKLFRKMQDFFYKLKSLFTRIENAHNVMRKLESGEVWNRENKKAAAGLANGRGEYLNGMSQKEIKDFVSNLETADIDRLVEYDTTDKTLVGKSKAELLRIAVDGIKSKLNKVIVDPTGESVYFAPGNTETLETYALHLVAGKDKGVEDIRVQRVLGVLVADKTIEKPWAIIVQENGRKMYLAMYRGSDDFTNSLIVGVEEGQNGRIVTSTVSTNKKGDKKAAMREFKKRINGSKEVLFIWEGLTGHSRPSSDQQASTTNASLHLSGEDIISQDVEKGKEGDTRVRYSLRSTDVGTAKDRLRNAVVSTDPTSISKEVKEQGYKGWLKGKWNSFYRDWVDKNDSLHGLDEAFSMKLGRKLADGEKIYDKVQMIPATAAGMSEALIEGDERHIEAINGRLKKKRLPWRVTLSMVLKTIDKTLMDKAHPNYLKDNGYKDWVDAFGHYLGYRRMAEMKRLHGDDYALPNGLTLQELDAEIKSAPAQFAKAAKMYYLFNDNLLTILEDAGIISEEVHKLLNDKYKEYCPLMRDFSDTAAADLFLNNLSNGGRGIGNVSTVLKRISTEGSERGIINPLETTIKSVAVMMNRAERNRVGQLAVEMGKSVDGIIKEMPTPKGGDAVADPKNCIFTVMIDGKKVAYQTTQELYGPIVGYNLPAAGMVLGIAKNAARMLRTGATMSPSFIIRNLIRDTIFAGISSKNGFVPIVDSVKGAHALLNDPKLKAEFEAAGVTSFNFYNNADKAYKSLVELNGGKELDFKNPLTILKAIGNNLEGFSSFIESATRMGEFKRAREAGKSIDEAARAARELTLDFSRSGVYGENVNQVVPFFNACIQGGDKLYRLFRDNPVGTAANIAKYIVLPSLVLWAMNHDDEEYKELDPKVKLTHWIIGDIRIPKPQEAGVLFGSGVEAMLDTATGQDKEAMKNWALQALDGFAPNIIPTLFLPLVEWQANYSFFRDGKLVGYREERLPDELQYKSNTSELSKGLGKLTGLSPIKIDNTVRGYTGTMGMLIWQAYDLTSLEKANLPEKKIIELPLIRDFFVNEYNKHRSVDEFYDMMNEAEKQHAGYGVKGKPTGYVKGIRAAAKKISDLRKDNREITDNPRLTPEAKRKLIDRNEKHMKMLAERANKVFHKFVYE